MKNNRDKENIVLVDQEVTEWKTYLQKMKSGQNNSESAGSQEDSTDDDAEAVVAAQESSLLDTAGDDDDDAIPGYFLYITGKARRFGCWRMRRTVTTRRRHTATATCSNSWPIRPILILLLLKTRRPCLLPITSVKQQRCRMCPA